MSETIFLSSVEYSFSSSTYPGQTESGDLHIIKDLPSKLLIGVVDGMGHGHEAAIAAKAAVDTLNANSHLSVINLVKLCHEKLKTTRGAVMALASINYKEETLTWISIGNIEGILLRSDPQVKPAYESIMMCPGVIGYRLTQLYATVVPITKGDMLILSTDGIRSEYILRVAADAHPISIRKVENPEEWSKDELIQESLLGSEKPVSSKKKAYSNDISLFESGFLNLQPHVVTDYITKHFVKDSDDALITVIKYLGKK